MAYDEYYKVFSTTSDEEKKIGDEILKENERFENTPEYKEHWEKIQTLMKKEHDLFEARLEKARELRPTRKLKAVKPAHKKVVDPKEEEKGDAVIKAIGELSNKEKNRVWFSCFNEEIPTDETMAIDDDVLDELHRVLVQTSIDFIKEKGLKNVHSISFSADSLQESADYGTWCPATDSFLEVEGIKHEEYVSEDGNITTIPYRVLIGRSF